MSDDKKPPPPPPPKPEKPRTIHATCNDCGGRETRHTILASCSQPITDGEEYSHSITFVFAQCGGCQGGHMLVYEGIEDPRYEVPAIYPPPERHRRSRHRYDYPPDVLAAYEDVVTALNHGLSRLCSVGLRMLIERVCRVESVSNIDGLVEKGVLAATHAQFLNRVRRAGSETAHEGDAATIPELAQALELVENLLNTVYILPEVERQLEASGEKRKKARRARPATDGDVQPPAPSEDAPTEG